MTDMVASAASWGALGFQDNGHTGGGNTGMIFGQLIFPPFIPASPESMLGNSPVLLGSFVVTVAADTYGIVDWSTGALGDDFVMEIFTDDGGAGIFTQLTAADIELGGITVFIFPAPSSVALLGLGGLVAGRRRR